MIAHPFSDQIVCQIRREHVHRQCCPHLVGVDLKDTKSDRVFIFIGVSMLRTVKVAITPSAICRHAKVVSTESNSGSLSSCKSLLYVEGSPLSVIKNPAIYEIVEEKQCQVYGRRRASCAQ